MSDIIAKIKKAQLLGRGGASFPVWHKWSAVAEAVRLNKNQSTNDEMAGECYVVCNASEGEPGVLKDGYLLENKPEAVIGGIKLAIDFFGATKGIIYLNGDYFKKYRLGLEAAIKANGSAIELFRKPHDAGYIGGEETTLLNVLEGKLAEPRLKPPYPTESGLWGKPTLVNNVETFYDVYRLSVGDYKPTRFYTVSGDCLFEGVFELEDGLTAKEVLRATHNYPKFDFFVQLGGDGSGEVCHHSQLDRPVGGAGTIHVYSTAKHEPVGLIRQWANFFLHESCGKCTPCREGTFRLSEVLAEPHPDWLLVRDFLDNLGVASFCSLGLSVPTPIISYIKNVLPKDQNCHLCLLANEKEAIIKAFK
jgi:NADH:ubiquinone oxidoreductase subunit F (NADH-binding)